MSEWYIYLIRCNDNTLYTGITIDVERRFKEHLSQGKKSAKYLRGKLPLKLVFQQKAGNRKEAAKLEIKVKKLSKASKEKIVATSSKIGHNLFLKK
ncbi:MAG: hypothetical protein ACD_79C00053G0003 [uncultured bacterium]|nr:MAG: hypothetical protein ACD_79C00053G0003 [uncultured bacterium]